MYNRNDMGQDEATCKGTRQTTKGTVIVMPLRDAQQDDADIVTKIDALCRRKGFLKDDGTPSYRQLSLALPHQPYTHSEAYIVAELKRGVSQQARRELAQLAEESPEAWGVR